VSLPLLEARDLVRHYKQPRVRLWATPATVLALNGVSFEVYRGRSFGVVGQSGSGKSTLARLILGLDRPTSGSVHFQGRDLLALPPADQRASRRDLQAVFQDPYGSLDPRHTVARIVTEPLVAQGQGSRAQQWDRALEVLERVGLSRRDLDKYPHEFSGGQRQRVAIARALICRPALIVADEPVSALDVSVQAQILNLLRDLAQEFGLTYVLISHDVSVVNYLCDEVAVMLQGRIVEQGPPQRVFSQPEHDYTRTLLAAMPPQVGF